MVDRHVTIGRTSLPIMRVHVGSDHAGFDLKALLVARLQDGGHEVVDHGGLGNSEGSGWLVEENHARPPEGRTTHGDGLALAAGQRGYGLVERG